jgi:hypothetical protein
MDKKAIWGYLGLFVAAFILRERCGASRLPTRRSFLPLRGTLGLRPDSLTLRVQQFNILADGLSGAREDLGRFSRASKDTLGWENRREALLHEIVQYGADVITMQECDHFHDFFAPRMRELGYTGYFAAKPTSGCLEVSENPDGCALFVKHSKFRVISCEAKSLALSIAKLKEGELEEDETSISQQNQITIIAVIEFINYKGSKSLPPKVYNVDDYNAMFSGELDGGDVLPGGHDAHIPPPIIVSTAHLKSSKTSTGERYRQKALLKILTEIERIASDFGAKGRQPAVLMAGDLNAENKPAPDQSKVFSLRGTYAPLTWNAARMHRLALRSVYHDDVSSIIGINSTSIGSSSISSGDGKEQGGKPIIPAMQAALPNMPPEDIYTTWKYRGNKKGEETGERVVKRHIDYIMYTPFRRGPADPAFSRPAGQRRRSSWGSSIATMPPRDGGEGGAPGDYNSNSNSNSKSSVVATKSDQLVISVLLRFVVYTFGGIIPITAVIDSSLSPQERVVVSMLAVIGLLVFEVSSRGTIFKPEIEEEVVLESIFNEVRPDGDNIAGQSSTGMAITASRRQGRELLKEVRKLSKRIQTEVYGRPGLQPLAILDLYGPGEVTEGGDLLPNDKYPSDHLSLGADFELLWNKESNSGNGFL